MVVRRGLTNITVVKRNVVGYGSHKYYNHIVFDHQSLADCQEAERVISLHSTQYQVHDNPQCTFGVLMCRYLSLFHYQKAIGERDCDCK